MELNSKEHNSEPAEQIYQQSEETCGLGEEVPDGYYRSPIFLGTMLSFGLGMFSVRLPFPFSPFEGVEE
jgi:hypothetical protein